MRPDSYGLIQYHGDLIVPVVQNVVNETAERTADRHTNVHVGKFTYCIPHCWKNFVPKLGVFEHLIGNEAVSRLIATIDGDILRGYEH